MNELKNFKELLAPKLGQNRNITHIEISKPPSNGVGSVMLKVRVTVQDENGKEQFLHLVGKKIPTSQATRNAFDIQRTFKKEVAFYDVILPVLRDFQKEEGIRNGLDNFAEFYGARYNLTGSDVVDEDAVLLLTDLSVRGFKNLPDRRMGFNLEEAMTILEDLAKFHSTVIAFRKKNNEVFENIIKPWCKNTANLQTPAHHRVLISACNIIRKNPKCYNFAKKVEQFIVKKVPHPRGPYAAIAHFDFWVYNIMHLRDEDKILKNVFVDFQFFEYRSCASDVFFFMWTSLQKTVLETKLDFLLKHYHRNFLRNLKAHNVDTTEFTYYRFLEEISLESDYEFGHTLIFTFLIKVLKEVSSTDMETFDIDINLVTPEAEEHIWYMVTECNRRGWLL